MRKVLMILMLTFILMISNVSALTLLSGDNIDFTNQDDAFFGETMVIFATENGRSETILFSQFEPDLNQDGYDLTGTGTITGTYDFSKIDYDTRRVSDVSLIGVLKTTFNVFADYEEFCGSVAPSNYRVKVNGNGLVCIGAVPYGQYGEIDSGTLDFQTTVKVTANGQTQKAVLTEQDVTSKITKRSDGGKFFVEVTGFTTDVNVIPNIGSNRAVFFQANGGQILIEDYNFRSTEISSLLDFNFDDCYSSFISSVDFCVNEVNNFVLDKVRPVSNSYNSGSIQLGSNSITYDDSNNYRQPNYRILIDAQWIGIDRPNGEPRIDRFDIGKITEGSGSTATLDFTNIGTGDGNFQISFSCNGVNINPLNPVFVRAGQSVSLSTNVQGFTSSGCSSYTCQATVTDITSGIKDTKSENDQVCEANQCNFDGQQRCIGNTANFCSPQNGVLVWVAGATCEFGCSLDNSGTATCDAPPVSITCNSNNLCDGIETFQTCPNDCSSRNDGYCSPVEKQQGTDPESCDTTQPPSGGSNTTLIIIGSLVGLGIIGALYYRFKIMK